MVVITTSIDNPVSPGYKPMKTVTLKIQRVPIDDSLESSPIDKAYKKFTGNVQDTSLLKSDSHPSTKCVLFAWLKAL